MKLALSECQMSCSGLHSWVYKNVSLYEMAFVIPDLKFRHVPFAILFCQNIVKKICKFVMRVFNEKHDIFFEKY